jgi:hypothetical protein
VVPKFKELYDFKQARSASSCHSRAKFPQPDQCARLFRSQPRGQSFDHPALRTGGNGTCRACSPIAALNALGGKRARVQFLRQPNRDDEPASWLLW